MLRLEDGRVFAQGACEYVYRPVTEQHTTSRIFILVEVEGVNIQALVDTGAPYLLCDPQIADLINVNPADGLVTGETQIHGFRITGTLHRLYLTLLAKEGQSLQLEVTAIVPDPQSTPEDLPTYLGIFGCLERLRFAIDPDTETFFFGPCSREP